MRSAKMRKVSRGGVAVALAKEARHAFAVLARSQAMSALRRGCGDRPRSASPAVQQFHSETLACARRSVWWFSMPSAATRGCASITNVSERRVNPARSPLSRRCESWSRPRPLQQNPPSSGSSNSKHYARAIIATKASKPRSAIVAASIAARERGLPGY